MNCKQGDLALVIAGPDTGTIVTCLEALQAGWERDDLPPFIHQQIDERAGPLWRVDRSLEWGSTCLKIAPDRALMPIRPDPMVIADENVTPTGALVHG